MRKYDCVFIGGLSKDVDKIPFLEKLAERVKIDFWGYGKPMVDKSSPIWKTYHGEAWGEDMLEILGQSKIVINRHTQKIGKHFESKYANNVRLFEATGMGALLITDMKENLKDFFIIGDEIITYSSLEELVNSINYFLKHDGEREEIAKAGQKRTLKDHTYEVRAKQLYEIINNSWDKL